MHVQKLIFVYNADSGFKNKLLDGAHKILRPDTYTCNLCSITYGALREYTVWKQFRQTAQIGMEFLYRDEFAKTYRSKFGYKFTFPIVLSVNEDAMEVFIGTQELDVLESAEDLVALIKARI